MTSYTYTRNGEPMLFGPFVTGEGEGAVEHPAAALTNWTDLELAAHGIVRTEVPTPAPTAADRLRELADCRWQKTQRFTFDNVETQADPAIAVVTARVVAAQFLPPNSTTKFKLADGEFRVWTTENLIAFGMAINSHVQACFDREEQLTEMIIAASDPSSVNIMTGWP